MMGEDKAIVMRAYELSSTGDFGRVTEQVDQDAPTRLIDNFITSKRPLRRSHGLPDLNITLEDMMIKGLSDGLFPSYR
jgi:hypothetical protein